MSLSQNAGIESVFPKQKYYAWYQQPTRDALQAAHSRVADRLSPSMAVALKPHEGRAAPIKASFRPQDVDLLTPPETPTTGTPASSADQAPVRRGPSHMAATYPQGGRAHRQAALCPATGMDTPISCPSSAGIGTPHETSLGPYDGLICFSQGCAVSTGLLLELSDGLGRELPFPVRFVILICGGRPFDADGSMVRVQATNAAPIKLSSIHIHGRQDPNYEESKQLASLYSDEGKQVIELDIGHCPPRRTSDVNMVAAAIRRAMDSLS